MFQLQHPSHSDAFMRPSFVFAEGKVFLEDVAVTALQFLQQLTLRIFLPGTQYSVWPDIVSQDTT